MHPGPRNALTDVPGLTVGAASDERLASGVTVVTGPAPFRAGVHVMGGAPGTRETDLLGPDKGVDLVDAVVLSGGSAYGLDAATGVVAGLRAAGRGWPAAGHRVPIVPAAILFDLTSGDQRWTDSPYPALGRAAFDAAGAAVATGTSGAGTGPTTATLKGGLGSASAVLDDGTTVAALVAANPVGDVVDAEGRFWAAPFEVDAEFGGRGPALAQGAWPTKLDAGANTTIAVVATDARLTKAEAQRLATVAHDGIARAIVPSHTPFDGDAVFALSTLRRPAPDAAGLMRIGHAAATCLARAIARGVHDATPSPTNAPPTWRARFGG